MPPPGTASALSIWPHVCACAHTLPSPGPKRIQPECSAQAAKLGPLAGTDEGAMSWVGVRLAWVTQGSGHRRDLQGRGGGGGSAAGGEGRGCCELGAGLLGAGGAGTPPLSPAPSLGLEDRAQGKSWYWGLGGHHPGPGKCSQVLTNAGAGGRGGRGMSQCPSREWGRDARPRAEIPVLKWLLCLSLQRGILKASPSLALSSSPPPPPPWGRSPGWPAQRWHAAPRPGRGGGGVPLTGQGVPTPEASRPNSCPPPTRAGASVGSQHC